MIDKLHDQCSPIPQHEIVAKVNELVDAANGTVKPVAKCPADQARLDLLIDLVNNGARLVSECEIPLVIELVDEGLVAIREPDGYWQITNAGRHWLAGRR